MSVLIILDEEVQLWLPKCILIMRSISVRTLIREKCPPPPIILYFWIHQRRSRFHDDLTSSSTNHRYGRKIVLAYPRFSKGTLKRSIWAPISTVWACPFSIAAVVAHCSGYAQTIESGMGFRWFQCTFNLEGVRSNRQYCYGFRTVCAYPPSRFTSKGYVQTTVDSSLIGGFDVPSKNWFRQALFWGYVQPGTTRYQGITLVFCKLTKRPSFFQTDVPHRDIRWVPNQIIY